MSVTYGQVEYERRSGAVRPDIGGGHEEGIARYLSENGITYLHGAVAPRDRPLFKRILAKPDFSTSLTSAYMSNMRDPPPCDPPAPKAK